MVKMVIVQPDSVGQRIDNFVFKHLKGIPKVRVYRAIRNGEVRVNQGRIKPEYRIKLDDKIRIPPLTGVRKSKIHSSNGSKPSYIKANCI